MDENTVKLGQIRLEDSFYEAKIHEPISPYCVRHKSYSDVEKNDIKPKGEDVLPIQGIGEEYREG